MKTKNEWNDSLFKSTTCLLGHSVGEFIAMYASSVFSFHDCAVVLVIPQSSSYM